MENNQPQKPKPSRLKRVLALAAAVLLFGMYAVTLVFALMDSPLAGSLLRASLFATLFIPVILYAAILMTRVFTRKRGGESEGQDI